MTALSIHLDEQTLLRVGITLLHFVWQGAVLATLFAAVHLLLRRASAEKRYLAASFTLLLMATVPVCTFFALPISEDAAERDESLMVGSVVESLELAASYLPPAKPEKLDNDGFEQFEPVVVEEPLHPVAAATPKVPAVSARPQAKTDAPVGMSANAHLILNVLVGGWLLGVFVFSVRLLGGCLVVRRLRRRFVKPAAEEWQRILQQLCERMQIGRRVRLLQSNYLDVPAVIGWLQPVILLPVGVMTGLTVDQLEAILAHELAHIRRHDYLVNLLQSLVETLLFYHPGVWWISRRMRIEREYCCDDLAVATCGNVTVYAKALADLEEFRSIASQLVVTSTGGVLLDRIKRLIGMNPDGTPAKRWMAGAVALTIPILLLAIGFREPLFGNNALTVATEDDAKPVERAAVAQKPDSPKSSVAEPAGVLQYGWKAGTSYMYSIKIEAELDDSIESFTGTSTYTVRAADDDGVTLSHRGHLSSWSRMKPQASFDPFSFRPPRFPSPLRQRSFSGGLTDRELRFDKRGNLLRTTGTQDLPYFLGGMAQLVIIPVHAEARQWKTSGERILREEQQDSRISYGLTRGLPGSPFAPKVTEHRAYEQRQFRLKNITAERATIAVKHKMRTHEAVGKEPKIQSVGEGTVEFDLTQGVPTLIEFSLTVSTSKPNVTRRTPITITCKFLDEKELARLKKVAEAAARLKIVEPDDIEKLLVDLKSDDPGKQRSAASRLAVTEPTEQRTEVAEQLHLLSADGDDYVRQWAVTALVVWGDESSMPTLLKSLDDKSAAVRQAAFKAVAAHGGESGARAIAPWLKESDRYAASQALQSMGSDAEPAVLSVMDAEDWQTRYEACRILEKIGTKKSLAALEAAKADANAVVRLTAERAVKVIQARISAAESD